MLIEKVIKNVHLKFAKDTDYPEADSEDLLVMLRHADDAISEWEDCVREGYSWPELITTGSVIFAGTGTDELPEDFLAFVRVFNAFDGAIPPTLVIGSTSYTEVKAHEGVQYEQSGASPYVFWRSGNTIKTLPAITGTVTMPYIKKATRYVTGAEETEIEMQNPKFIEDFVTAKTYLDNEDDTMYQSSILQAGEKLDKMKYDLIS